MERLRLKSRHMETKTERLRLKDLDRLLLKFVHFLRHINISIFKQQRLTYFGPFLKIHQHFYFHTPEADINWLIC